MSFELHKFEDLGERIEQAKREKDQVQGRLDAANDRLKMDFDITSDKEGKLELGRLAAKITKIRKQLETKWEKLVEDYEWD